MVFLYDSIESDEWVNVAVGEEDMDEDGATDFKNIFNAFHSGRDLRRTERVFA